MLQITIDAFSGRPNPKWMVDGIEATDLLKELSRNRGAIADMDSGPQGLGYRGIVIEAMSDELVERYDIPSEFRIANGGSMNDQKGFEIAERLVRSMQKYASISDFGPPVPFDQSLEDAILQQLDEFDGFADDDLTELDGAPSDDEAPGDVTCYIEVGKFNPAFWNRAEVIRKNNCYNYASNWKTNTFAQPGKGCGSPITQLVCADVTRAALCDGCHKRYDCFPDSEKPRWLIALVVAPGYDYHWYRKQKEGFWGHKPGGTAARNTDNAGKVISDPRTCARKPYTDFCGYFYSCKTQQRRIK